MTKSLADSASAMSSGVHRSAMSLPPAQVARNDRPYVNRKTCGFTKRPLTSGCRPLSTIHRRPSQQRQVPRGAVMPMVGVERPSGPYTPVRPQVKATGAGSHDHYDLRVHPLSGWSSSARTRCSTAAGADCAAAVGGAGGKEESPCDRIQVAQGAARRLLGFVERAPANYRGVGIIARHRPEVRC